MGREANDTNDKTNDSIEQKLTVADNLLTLMETTIQKKCVRVKGTRKEKVQKSFLCGLFQNSLRIYQKTSQI